MKRFFAIVVLIAFFVGCKKNNTTPTSNSPHPRTFDGTNGSIYAMTVYNNNLVIGGSFDSAGNIAAKNIVVWNGSNWSAIGEPGPISSLYVYNGNLIAGTVEGGDIMQWNGSSWKQIGKTFGGLPEVLEFTTYNGNLIACGTFDSITGIKTGNIAQWDGSTWSALGGGLISGFGLGVTSITVYKGNLVAGVSDTVEEWNGSTWLSIASKSGEILAMCVDNNNLIVAGNFDNIAGIGASGIAQWNGSTWSSLNHASDYVYCVCVYKGNIITGEPSFITMLNGLTWSTIGDTEFFAYVDKMYADGQNNACIVYNGDLYIAGQFDPDNILMWNGSTWSYP